MTWSCAGNTHPSARGNATEDITPITRHHAGQISTRLAYQYWPPDAAQLSWVTAAYPS